MMNERVIKIAHLAAIAAIMLAAAIVVAQQSGGQQNDNSSSQQNSNSNRQGNTNANGNAGGSANQNTGRADTNAGNRNAGGGQGAALSATDRKFVMEAAVSGMAEVELGRMAAERGASDAVKQFGQRMVDDHTRANAELMQLAAGAGVTPPAALDSKHQAVATKMSRLSGAEFDRAYGKQMVAGHQKAVSLFQREADRGTHAGLKSFAATHLPALQEHLRMARELPGGGGGSGNTNTNANANTSGTNNNMR